uniref:ERCC4 domain-containing protein n=1 Tax=viral metagenome TaxID=1070528 RepID=A0A6C0JNG8_9ZZZZ
MQIIIDKREYSLYEKCQELLSKNSTQSNITLIQRELAIGDILIQTNDCKDVLLIERKTFSDLLASIKDGRYSEQSHRILNTSELPPHSVIYLIEGMFSQLSNPKDKKIIYSTMTTLHYFKGFSVYRVSGTLEAAEWLINMSDKLQRGFERGNIPYYKTEPFLNTFNGGYSQGSENNDLSGCLEENTEKASKNYCNFVKKVKKDNITPQNIGEIILCQIPGISSITAITIMKKFGTFPNLIQELQNNSKCLDGISCETNGKTRKISKTCIENIHKFLIQ